MAFDVRSFTAAHEPWSFTDDQGRVWQPARELSAPAVMRWLGRIELVEKQVASGTLSQAQALDRWLSVTRRIIRSMFPWRPRYWWSGDPSRAFDRLPMDARQAAIEALFRSRGLRTSTQLPSPTPTIPRPSSASWPPIRTVRRSPGA